MKQTGRRHLKKQVLTLLEGELSPQGEELFQYSLKSLLNPLFIALCHPTERVRWNAVRAFGLVVPRLAEKQPEEARIVMRRFLWSLNDESGGIGWGAPEAMASIMAKSELLRKEYVHMLISYMREDGPELFEDGNFLELPMLQRGLLWGVGLLCHCFPEELKQQKVQEDILFYLDSPDIQVAGLALWALAGLGVKLPENRLSAFLNSKELIALFQDGELQELTLARLAMKLQ